jgi:hypothetical protein
MECTLLRVTQNEYRLLVYHLDKPEIKIVMIMTTPDDEIHKRSQKNDDFAFEFGI